MKNNRSKASFYLLLVLIFIGFGEASTVYQKQRDLDSINQEIARQQELLQETKQKEKSTLRDIYLINKKINLLKNDLAYTKSKLDSMSRTLALTEQEIENASQKYLEKEILLKKRLKEIYKSQNLGYLQFLFASDNFTQFLDNSYYYGKIVESDIMSLDEISRMKTNLHQKKRDLGKQQDQMLSIKNQVQQQQSSYINKVEEKRSVYSNLIAQRRDYEKNIAELLRNSQEIEEMLQRISREGATGARGTGHYIWPLKGMITSYYGVRRHPIFKIKKMHTGIDIAAKMGTKIAAADSGVVVFSGWWGGYGKATIIDHGNNKSTVYGHQLRIYVQKGQTVKQGQVIGLVGSTGYSTGPHLHFEVRLNGKTTNPLNFLDK